MAATTKLELSQHLATRNKELEAARLRIAELEGDVAALKAVAARQPTPRPVYTPPAPSAAQLTYRAKCAAAREAAMRTGRAVAV